MMGWCFVSPTRRGAANLVPPTKALSSTVMNIFRMQRLALGNGNGLSRARARVPSRGSGLTASLLHAVKFLLLAVLLALPVMSYLDTGQHLCLPPKVVRNAIEPEVSPFRGRCERPFWFYDHPKPLYTRVRTASPGPSEKRIMNPLLDHLMRLPNRFRNIIRPKICATLNLMGVTNIYVMLMLLALYHCIFGIPIFPILYEARTTMTGRIRLFTTIVMAAVVVTYPLTAYIGIALISSIWVCDVVAAKLFSKLLDEYNRVILVTTDKYATLASTITYDGEVHLVKQAKFLAVSDMEKEDTLIIATDKLEYAILVLRSIYHGSGCTLAVRRSFEHLVPFHSVWTLPKLLRPLVKYALSVGCYTVRKTSILWILLMTWSGGSYYTKYDAFIAMLLTLAPVSKIHEFVLVKAARYVRADLDYMEDLRKRITALSSRDLKSRYGFIAGIMVILSCPPSITFLGCITMGLLAMSHAAQRLQQVPAKKDCSVEIKRMKGIRHMQLCLGLGLSAFMAFDLYRQGLFYTFIQCTGAIAYILFISDVSIGITMATKSAYVQHLLTQIVDSSRTSTTIRQGRYAHIRSDRARMMRYGTRGDVLPMDHLASNISDLGCTVTPCDIFSVDESTVDLGAIEAGFPSVSVHPVQEQARLASFLSQLRVPVFGNYLGLVRGAYSMTAQMFSYKLSRGVSTGSFILNLLQAGVHVFDHDPAGFQGDASALEFSANGKNPLPDGIPFLRKVLMLWKPDIYSPKILDLDSARAFALRKPTDVLICTGSSRNVGPLPEEFQSCDIHQSSKGVLKGHVGDIIYDTNHPSLMKKYKLIVTHGGAGTVKTALASGADVVSISDALDRVLKPGPCVVMPGTPYLSILYWVLLHNPNLIAQFFMNRNWMRLILLTTFAPVYFAYYLQPINVIKIVFNISMIIARASVLFGGFVTALQPILSYQVEYIETMQDTMGWGASILGGLIPYLDISYLPSTFASIAPVSLSPSAIFSAWFSELFLVSGASVLEGGELVATFQGFPQKFSHSAYIEIWTHPVAKLFEHAFIRAGNRWFEMEMVDDPTALIPSPKIHMIELDKPPEGEHTCFRTGIRSSQIPSQGFIQAMARPVNYHVVNNCLTGTLCFLRACKQRSLIAEVMVTVWLLKASPFLTAGFFWTLIRGAIDTSWGNLPTLGMPNNRVRAIMEKVGRNQTISDLEIAVLLRNKYAVVIPPAGRIKLVESKSIGQAYSGSRLSPYYTWQNDFRLFIGRLSKDQAIELRQRLDAKIEKEFKKLLGKTIYSTRHGTMKVTPKVMYNPKGLFSTNICQIGTDLAKASTPGHMLCSKDALLALLRVVMADKGHKSGYNLRPWLIPTGPGARVSDIDTMLGNSTVAAAVISKTMQEQAIALSIANAVNVIVYCQTKAPPAADGRVEAEQRLSTATLGVIFDKTCRLIHDGNRFAAITMQEIDYISEVVDATPVVAPLETYIPLFKQPDWLGYAIRYMPAKASNLMKNPAFAKDFCEVVAAGFLGLTKIIENTFMIFARIILFIVMFRYDAGAMLTDPGARIKPSIPIVNVNIWPKDHFNALHEIGLPETVVPPQWKKDTEQPNVLVHPSYIEYGRRHWEAEDVLDNWMNESNIILSRVSDDWILNPNYRRHYNTLVHKDEWMTKKRHMAIALMQAEIGVNNADYATEEATRISLQRYQKNPFDNKVTDANIKEYTDAIHAMKLPEYKGFKFWPVNKALKDLKKKMNLGYGLEGAKSPSHGPKRGLRKRADLLRMPEARKELIEKVREDLKSSELRPLVYSSFPKAYKYLKERMEGHPEKLRTIVTPDIVSLLSDACIFKSTDLEMKRNWKSSATAIGLPWKALAINEMFNTLPQGSQNFIFDMTEFDATHGNYVPKLLADLYAPGFDTLPKDEQALIHDQIEARWKRIQSGGVIYDLNHGIIIPKVRGSATGSVSVTRPNTEVSRFGITLGFAKVWGVSIKEAVERLAMITMGDDSAVTNLWTPVHPDDLRKAVFEEAGLQLKVEFQKDTENGRHPDWDGATFLSHTLKDPSNFRDELRMAGVEEGTPTWPSYCYLYDKQKLAMRQTVALRKTTPFKEYESIRSYMQKAVHYPEMHEALSAIARELVPIIEKRKNGLKFLAKRPLLPYLEEIRQFYLKLYKERLIMQSTEARMLQTWLTYTYIATGLSNVLMLMRLCGLGTLGCPRPLESASPLFQTGSFIIELFVYKSHIELYGIPPNYQTFQKLCGGNPYASTTDPPLAWDAIQHISKYPHLQLSEGEIYGRYQWLSMVFIILRMTLTWWQINVMIFNILNKLYTICFGVPAFWWGIFSEIGTLANNHASARISAMVPRDPFRMSKAFACLIVDMIPPVFFNLHLSRSVFVTLENMLVHIADLMFIRDPVIGKSEYLRTRGKSDDWDRAFANDIMPGLTRYNRICVHAPTGSGKSQVLGNLLLTKYDRVFYIVPRRSAADQMHGFTKIDRHTQWPNGAGKYVMTGGHALHRYWKDPKADWRKSIIVFDEYDDKDGSAIVFAYDLARLDSQFILLSATADRKLAELLDADRCIINVRVKPRFVVANFLAPANSSIITLAAENYRRESRILIIEPSVQRCESIRDSLQVLNFDVETMFSGDAIPESKIIVASQTAEKSITIEGVSLVIDSGTMIRSHKGVVVKRTIDIATMIQRAGRTGRTCDGRYVTMLNPVEQELVTYPSIEVATAFPENTNKIWGTRLDLQPSAETSEYTTINNVIRIRKDSVPPKYRPSAILKFVGSCVLACESVTKLEHVISLLEYGHENSYTEHILTEHRAIINSIGPVGLGKFKNDADELFNNIVFNIVDAGVIKAGNTVKLVEGQLVTFAHDNNPRDEVQYPLIGFNRDTFRPEGSNIPYEVSLIRSLQSQVSSSTWLFHFTSILNYYLYGSFLEDTDTDGMTAIAEMFAIPHDGRTLDDEAQVIAILSGIAGTLRSDILFLDCSKYKQEWVQMNVENSSAAQLNIAWLYTGELYFFRSEIIYPIRKALDVKLSTLVQFPSPNAPASKTTTPSTPAKPTGPAPITTNSSGKPIMLYNTCAFDTLRDMIWDMVPTAGDKTEFQRDIVRWTPFIPPVTAPNFLGQFTPWAVQKYADERDSMGLADALEIWDKMGLAVDYSVINDRNTFITIRNAQNLPESIKAEAKFTMINDVPTFTLMNVTPGSRLGTHLVLHNEMLDMTLLNTVARSNIHVVWEGGEAECTLRGVIHYDNMALHYDYFAYRDITNMWVSTSGGIKNKLFGIARGFSLTVERRGSDTSSGSMTQDIEEGWDSFFDAMGDTLFTVPLATEEELKTVTIEELHDVPSNLAVWSKGNPPAPCIPKSLIKILGHIIESEEQAEEEFYQSYNIDVPKTRDERRQALNVGYDMIEMLTGHGIMCLDLRDTQSGPVYRMGMLRRSQSERYYILINYHSHVTIGTYIKRDGNKSLACHDYDIYKQIRDFDYSHEYTETRSHLPKAAKLDCHLRLLRRITPEETREICNYSIFHCKLEPEECKANREIVARVLQCKTGKDNTICRDCLSAANILSTTQKLTILYVDWIPKQVVYVNPRREMGNKYLLIRHGAFHRLHLVTAAEPPALT